jgi:hypothetical protein
VNVQPADPWGFAEEPVETWADILGAQASDLLWLTAFLTLALVSFKRKSVALKYLTLLVAVAYMGFAKSHLVSITNIFSVIDGNLPVVKYNLAFYLLIGFTIVSTVLLGRFYCGRVCAFGALTQLMDAVLPRRWRVNVPRSIERRAGWIKFALLGGTLVYFIASKDVLVYRYVEPFWMFGLFATTPLRAAGRLDIRSQSLLPVPLPRRCGARPAVVRHGVSHQALVGVRHMPHL